MVHIKPPVQLGLHTIRRVFLVLFFSTGTLFFAAQTLAQSTQQPVENDISTSQLSFVDQMALDELFISLASATDANKATEIANNIWRLWFTPTQPNLAQRMQALGVAQQARNSEISMRILDSIVADFPDYVEGWNQRATLFYNLGNMQASLDDVDEVLAREPRHFGALSGLAMIYRQLGKDELALEAILRGLSVHPFLAQRAMFEQLLTPPTNT